MVCVEAMRLCALASIVALRSALVRDAPAAWKAAVVVKALRVCLNAARRCRMVYAVWDIARTLGSRERRARAKEHCGLVSSHAQPSRSERQPLSSSRSPHRPPSALPHAYLPVGDHYLVSTSAGVTREQRAFHLSSRLHSALSAGLCLHA